MTSVHNTKQNSSDNLPSYLQTNITAQMLSIRGEGGNPVRNAVHASLTLVVLTAAGIASISRSRKMAVPCNTSRSSRTISVVPPSVMMYLGLAAAAFTTTLTVGTVGSRPSVQLSTQYTVPVQLVAHYHMLVGSS